MSRKPGLVARLLGEDEDTKPADAHDAVDSPKTAEAPATSGDYSNPTIDQLLQLWQSGQHEAVALRVLDALDMYEDFLELAFRIGHDGARELGHIMDEFTSHETSPHEYDRLPDEDVPMKFGKRPMPGEGGGAALGASQ
jgi:hypothetical protein